MTLACVQGDAVQGFRSKFLLTPHRKDNKSNILAQGCEKSKLNDSVSKVVTRTVVIDRYNLVSFNSIFFNSV